jgi:PAS domain S-box-containing protein
MVNENNCASVTVIKDQPMVIRKAIKLYCRRTISRDLTVGLTSTLIIIITIVSVLYYTHTASIAERDLEKYADRVAREFSQNIAWPMFNFEMETVRYIADASLQSESLVGISVSVESNVVFEHLPESLIGTFNREKHVVWNGEAVGLANLIFSRTNIEAAYRSLMTLMILILTGVILTSIAATHFILKSFLNRPLRRLTQGIQKIADGDYTNTLGRVPHSDINLIVDEINRMAVQINKRSQQLVESEEKYRSIFENAVEGMFTTSIDGRFLDVNPAMAAILGYDCPQDLIGSVKDIAGQMYVSAEQLELFLEQLEKNHMVQGFELEIRRKNGKRIWVASNARAIRDSEGKLVGVEGFLVDVSLRKQMEMERRQAHDELELRVSERTRELQEKTGKLKRTNKMFIHRELRMKELKTEVEKLKAKLAEKERLT